MGLEIKGYAIPKMVSFDSDKPKVVKAADMVTEYPVTLTLGVEAHGEGVERKIRKTFIEADGKFSCQGESGESFKTLKEAVGYAASMYISEMCEAKKVGGK